MNKAERDELRKLAEAVRQSPDYTFKLNHTHAGKLFDLLDHCDALEKRVNELKRRRTFWMRRVFSMIGGDAP